jgi:deoxyribonuclease-4
MLLGIHISTRGKLADAPSIAHSLGCETMQIFSHNPVSWRKGPLASQEIDEFNRAQNKFKIKPVFIHVPYLINLASPNPKLYHASINAYTEDIVEASLLNADYIVTHMGSHKETSEKSGIKRLTEALNIIIEATKDSPVGILLENTAGSGSWLGYNFSHHHEIIAGLDNKERVGLCVDTAHAYLAGYDLAAKEGFERLLREIDDLVGLDLIKAVHLNDAKGALGSHHDRHDHIGKGSIGMEGIRRIVNHPRLKNLPFILETPKDDEDSDKTNLATVRKLRE